MSENAPRRPRVVIAGASGFIGRALIPRLATRLDVVALSRATASEAADPSGVRWQRCDLFSLRETSLALAGADYAVYLVHSMMPSARLSRGVPVTAVRAGLVVGAGGASFQILVRLVRRLPVMLCPSWTRTPTQPIALADVVEVLAGAVGAPDAMGAVLDVGGPDVLSYREMMQRTAMLLGKRARAFSVPFFTPGLSRLWVTLVTQTPRALVAPLIQSLRHPMVSSSDELTKRLGRPGLGFEESMRTALADEAASPEAKREAQLVALAHERRRLRAARTVRSIQRLRAGRRARSAASAAGALRFAPMALRPQRDAARRRLPLGSGRPPRCVWRLDLRRADRGRLLER